jgi:hypothetical protein
MQGTGKNMPIALTQTMLDFLCCFFDTIYHDKLILHNNSDATVKVAACVPDSAATFIKIAPKFGYVQPRCDFAFGVTVSASQDVLARCAKYVVDDKFQILEIPISLSIPSQNIIPSISMRVQLTTSELIFTPAELSIGKCILGESKGACLRITNPSSLTQTFAMSNLPPGVRITPKDGMGVILPGSSISCEVFYTPTLPGRHAFNLVCSTLALRSFKVPCTAEGTTLPLQLQHNRFELAATAVRDCTSASTALINTTDTSQRFHFAVPRDCGLRVTPQSGEMGARERARIQIDFVPNNKSSTDDGNNAALAMSASCELARDVEVDKHNALEDQRDRAASISAPLPRVDSVHVPCYVQSCVDAQGNHEALHVTVETCTIQPLVDLLDMRFDSHHQRYVHSFGDMPTGSTSSVRVAISSCCEADLPLTLDPMDPMGAFEQVTAARTIPAKGTGFVTLHFKPVSTGTYWEVVTLRVPGQAVQLQLSGQGIQARLELEGSSVDMGDVHVGEDTSQIVTLRNPCPFPLSCTCRFRQRCPPNVGNVAPYIVFPETLLIGAGETGTVSVSFQPDFQVLIALRWSAVPSQTAFLRALCPKKDHSSCA